MTSYLPILKRKERAAEFFIQQLLESKVKDSIAKVVLFGSTLKRKVRKDSDIDVLVIATDSLKEVAESCADASLETGIFTDEGVEPLVRCIDEVRYPQSYFLYYQLRHGREVYQMNAKELKEKEIKNYLGLSQEYLEGAKGNYQNRHWRIAVDAGYNAAELLMKGLLLFKLRDIPGSHSGIVNKFGELYARTGLVSRQMGRTANWALQKRNDARYEPHAEITDRDAKEIIDFAEELFKILEKKLAA
ncbi:MAG: HEPN domain-containing protein [Candidatus Edwardsbacteria bacterium]